MFLTSCVRHQEDYIVHAALYGMFFMRLCKLSSRWEDVLSTDGIPDDHVVFETCRRHEELN
jgi:hypothetical protein